MWPKGATVYVQPVGAVLSLTVASPDKSLVVVCHAHEEESEARRELEEAGHTVRTGRWLTADQHGQESGIWIAAVAYNSDVRMPGLWVDVFPYPPTVSEVTTRMLKEFNEDGTLGKMENEEFHKVASPNIVILDPSEIRSFLRQHLSNAETLEEPVEMEVE